MTLIALALVSVTNPTAASYENPATPIDIQFVPDIGIIDNTGGGGDTRIGISVTFTAAGYIEPNDPDREGGYRLEVYDESGVLVRRLASLEIDSAITGLVYFDGRRDSGLSEPLKEGSYEIGVSASNRRASIIGTVGDDGILVDRPREISVSPEGVLSWTNTGSRRGYCQVTLTNPVLREPEYLALVDAETTFGDHETWTTSDGHIYSVDSTSCQYFKHRADSTLRYAHHDTRLVDAVGIAVWQRTATGETYVMIACGQKNEILIYREGATGDAALLVRTITSDSTVLVEPRGIAMRPDASLLVVDRGNRAIKCFDQHRELVPLPGAANGVFIQGTDTTWDLTNPNGFSSPGAVAVDTDGFIYVFDEDDSAAPSQCTLKKFSPNGAPMGVLTQLEQLGWFGGDGPLDEPILAATFGAGSIYAISTDDAARVLRIGTNGQLLAHLGTASAGADTPEGNTGPDDDPVGISIGPYYDRQTGEFLPEAVFLYTRNQAGGPDSVSVFRPSLAGGAICTTVVLQEVETCRSSANPQAFLVDQFGEIYAMHDSAVIYTFVYDTFVEGVGETAVEGYHFMRKWNASCDDAALGSSMLNLGWFAHDGRAGSFNRPHQAAWIDSGSLDLNGRRFWVVDAGNHRVHQLQFVPEWGLSGGDCEGGFDLSGRFRKKIIVVNGTPAVPSVMSASVTGRNVYRTDGRYYVRDGTCTLSIYFNKNMKTTAAPTVTFKTVDKPNAWHVTAISYERNIWQGEVTITAEMQDGPAEISVKNARDATDVQSPNPDATDLDLSDDFRPFYIDQSGPVLDITHPPVTGDTVSSSRYEIRGRVVSESTGLDAVIVVRNWTEAVGGTNVETFAFIASAIDGTFVGTINLREPDTSLNYIEIIGVDHLNNNTLLEPRRLVRRIRSELPDIVTMQGGGGIAGKTPARIAVRILDADRLPAAGRSVLLIGDTTGLTLITANPQISGADGAAYFDLSSGESGFHTFQCTVDGLSNSAQATIVFTDSTLSSGDQIGGGPTVNVLQNVISGPDVFVGPPAFSAANPNTLVYILYDGTNWQLVKQDVGGAPTVVISNPAPYVDTGQLNGMGSVTVANIEGTDYAVVNMITRSSGRRSQIFAVNLQSGSVHNITPNNPATSDDLPFNNIAFRWFDLDPSGEQVVAVQDGNLVYWRRQPGDFFDPSADSPSMRYLATWWGNMYLQYALDNTPPVPANTRYYAAYPSWSPDGSKIAFTLVYVSDFFANGIPVTRSALVVIDVPSEPEMGYYNPRQYERKSTLTDPTPHIVVEENDGLVLMPRWSPNGDGLFYTKVTDASWDWQRVIRDDPADPFKGLSAITKFVYLSSASGTPYPPMDVTIEPGTSTSLGTYGIAPSRAGQPRFAYVRRTASGGIESYEVRTVDLGTTATVTAQGGVLFDSGRIIAVIPANEAYGAGLRIASSDVPVIPGGGDSCIISGAAKSFYSPDDPSQPVTFADSITIMLYYDAADFTDTERTGPDADGDGISDQTESTVTAYYWNGTNWVDYGAVRYPGENKIEFQTTHFSIYAVGVPLQAGGAAVSWSVHDVIIYPNPWRADGVTSGRSASDERFGIKMTRLPGTDVRVRIFSTVGEAVLDGVVNCAGGRSTSPSLRVTQGIINDGDNLGTVSWNLTNGAAHNIASGVYLIILDGAGGRVTRRVAVIR